MTEDKEQLENMNFHKTDEENLPQDEEFILIDEPGKEGKRKILYHDYDEIYSIPGLYEHLFYEKLKCQSPQTIAELMVDDLKSSTMNEDELVVLDVGAGNGMVGEELNKMGVKSVVGVDIIQEAANATERDRPDTYEDYFVADLTSLTPSTKAALDDKNFNCLVTVSALGFGDIPPLAFAEAYNLVSSPGLIAFNIKDEFVNSDDSSGFSRLIDQITDMNLFEVSSEKRYCHRLSMSGDPLYYVAMVGRKNSDIPQDMLDGMV